MAVTRRTIPQQPRSKKSDGGDRGDLPARIHDKIQDELASS
jgi:hypothetical protein